MDGVSVFLDSSVVLARLFEEPSAIRGWQRWERAVVSELLWLEVHRVLDRQRLLRPNNIEQISRRAAEFRSLWNGLEVMPLSGIVLRRASAPMPAPVATLDAIHLSTALLWIESRSDLLFLTHDRQLASAARACGLDVAP